MNDLRLSRNEHGLVIACESGSLDQVHELCERYELEYEDLPPNRVQVRMSSAEAEDAMLMLSAVEDITPIVLDLVCSSCGSHNRFSFGVRPGVQWPCGNCKAMLTIPPEEQP